MGCWAGVLQGDFNLVGVSKASSVIKNLIGLHCLILQCLHNRDVARLIIQSNQWEQALQNTVVPLAHHNAEKSCTTPLRRLIMKMPGLLSD